MRPTVAGAFGACMLIVIILGAQPGVKFDPDNVDNVVEMYGGGNIPVRSPPMVDYLSALKYGQDFAEDYPKVVNLTARVIDFRKALRKFVGDVREVLRVAPQAYIEGQPADARRPAVVYTCVMNEPVYLQAWIAHYSKTFLPQDMFVIDNNVGRDGTMSGLRGRGINVVNARCDHSYLDHQCILSFVSTMSRLLLSTYKVVVYTDVDELLFSADPRRTLWEYLCNFKLPATRVDTRTPMETPCRKAHSVRSLSPPFNWNLDQSLGGGYFAAQREKWYVDRVFYAKPLIHTRPISWIYGYHRASLEEPLVFDNATGKVGPIRLPHLDEDRFGMPATITGKDISHIDFTVILLHMHRLDKAYYIHRQRWKGGHTRTLKNKLGWMEKLNGSEFDALYWGTEKLRDIPPTWRSIEANHLAQRPTGRCDYH